MGPAQGREALAPSNMMNVISAVAMYKLAARTTLNGTLQLTNQRQDADLIPWTINSVIDQPATFNNFPHLANLPRSSADAEAQGVNALINFSSQANPPHEHRRALPLQQARRADADLRREGVRSRRRRAGRDRGRLLTAIRQLAPPL
jgi:hypothetical protein